MNSHPLDQLDANAPDKDSSDTTQPPIKTSDNFRKFFDDPKSLAKIKAKSSIQPLDSQDPSQQSTQSFGSSQVDDNQNNPLLIAQTEELLHSVIFPENVTKPGIKTALPGLQERIERTDQLLYCNMLLRQDSVVFSSSDAREEKATDDPADALQASTLDKGEQKWLAKVKKDPMAQGRMQWLVIKMVEAFIVNIIKDSTTVAEIVALGPVLEREPYRKLLSSFIAEFDGSRVLDVDLLQGLVQLVQSASPGVLVSEDLVKVLSLLRTHLEGTHQQSSEHLCHLTMAVSRILDVMADHKVQGLDRVMDHGPLSAILSELKGSSDPYLTYLACYAFQALQYVPDDETALQAVSKHLTGELDALVKATSVMKLDLGSVLKGLENLQEITTATAYGGAGSLLISGRGLLESLREGFRSGQKRPWYPTVRAAYALVQSGQLKDLKQLIYEAPCRHDPLYQWGICQLLGEIAFDSVWTVATRQQAIDLLGHLYKENREWGRDESVKAWILTILDKLGFTPDQAVNQHALALLQKLDSGSTPRTQHPHPLRSRLPIPESSPILAKVQGIPNVEYDLHILRIQRLNDTKLSIYISLMAKASLEAQDNEVFPLMDKVQEFLAGDGQVMLILGDSSVGKSTFNRHLEYRLWTEYKRGGLIPLFIYLPLHDRPDDTLVTGQLKMHKFSDEQIQELKHHRQFILICDGYDESQRTSNLYTTNLFNQSGRWNVKLIITCRTQYLGPDHRIRFEPEAVDQHTRVANDRFQQAVIVPFSTEQIKDYVEQYVPLKPRTWRTEDYMEKLTTIPTLMDLVKNPLLLSLALEALPGVVEGKQDLSTIRITRAQLYDTVMKHWSSVNERRLLICTLSTEDRAVLDGLLDGGFVSTSIDYSTRLALAIFEKQDGNPIVQYVHYRDKNTWRAQFFGQDPNVRLLRDSSPLTRSGNLYRFLHQSLLEYFFSCAIFNPRSQDDEDGSTPQTNPVSPDNQLFDTNSPLFTRNLLTEPSVIQFLSDRVKQSARFKRYLLAVVKLSKSNAQASQAAANAITVLNRADEQFHGADLRGIRIPGADLTGGQFDSAQLQDADLTGVNLSKAWIRQADLSRASMDGTQFGELPYLEELEKISSCVFSPNGKFLAAGLDNGNISIYDAATWTKIQVFQGHQDRVTSLAYSPNSQQLLSGGWDKTARLWDSKTGSTHLILKGHSDKVREVAFSPTGQQVASASDDMTVRLWDARTGAVVFVLTDNNIVRVTDIAYSPKGNTIASTLCGETIRIFDTLTGLLALESCKGGSDWIMCLTYSLDGQRIATGSLGGRLQLWEVAATAIERGREWAAHTSIIDGVSFSPDDRWIASSSPDHTVKLWDSRSGLLISSFVNHVYSANCVRFSPNGSYIASTSNDKTLRLWEVNSSSLGLDSYDSPDQQLCATYSPDGRRLITGSEQKPMRQLNADSGDVDFVFPNHLHNIDCIAFSPDGLQIAIGGIGREVTLWSAESRAASFVLSGLDSGVQSVAFSPCGRWLASGGIDSSVRLWDTRSGGAGRVLIGHMGDVQSLAFSPNGYWIASVCKGGKIQLWEIGTGELKVEKSIDIGYDRWNIVVYKPGCLQMASSHGDGTIRLWEDDQQLQGFRYILKQDQVIFKFAFSSCGQWVATVHSTCLRLWRLPSPDQDQEALPLQEQDCVSVIEGFTGVVEDVVWRPNKLQFATASAEGSVRAWRVVADKDGSGRVSVDLVWSSGPDVLVASGAVLNDVIGLSAMNCRLLEQRGANESASFN